MSEATGFEIENMDDLRRVLIMAQGGDPDARQALTDFMSFEDDVERTNLPTRRDVHLVSFLKIVSASYFPYVDNDPFFIFAKHISKAFMALRGNKSEQFVTMMKQTPSLSDLQMMQEPAPRSLRERFFGRREGE